MNANGSQPSLAGWQQKAVHTVTCPSGQRLRVRLPGIATLLERGELPGSLAGLAVMDVIDELGSAGAIVKEREERDPAEMVDRLREFADYQRHLARSAIVAFEAGDEWVNVTLTDADMEDLPEGDLSMVAELVQRLRNTDARGVRIGVEPLDRWNYFREVHGCGPDCPACDQILDEFSTADVDDV
jgi:hypothetical protein